MAKTPAALLGLENKGYIKPGADADLIVVNVNDGYVISAADFESKAKYSPYDGRTVMANVILTIVGGIVAFLEDN